MRRKGMVFIMLCICVLTIDAGYWPWKIHFIDGVYYDLYSESGYYFGSVTNGDPEKYDVADTICTTDRSGKMLNTNTVFSKVASYVGDIEIPECVEYNDTVWPIEVIELEAFANCKELTSIKLPSSIKGIMDKAFYGCTKLHTIELPSGLYSIGSAAFSKTGINELYLPDSIQIINSSGHVKYIFGENIPIYNYGYCPWFNENAGIYSGNISESTMLLPQSHFSMMIGSFVCDEIETLIIPEIERFYSNIKSIVKGGLKRIVSMSAVPPVIDGPSAWYNRKGANEYSEEEWIELEQFDKLMKSRLPESGLLADYSGVELVVPRGSEEAYRSAPVWKNFAEIRGVDSFDEFLGQTASAGAVAESASELQVSADATGVRLESAKAVEAEILNPKGETVRKVAVNGETYVELGAGIYIVRGGGAVVKIKI